MTIESLARPEVLALEPYVSARMLADAPAVALDANECPWALFGEPDWVLNRYPDPQPQALISALAERYGVSGDHLLATRGSDEGIDLLVRAFCRPGLDNIITCPPCFGMYQVAAGIQGAGVRSIPLSLSQFEVDIESILAVAQGARLLFLCSPNNPTGGLIQGQTVQDLCRQLAGQCLVVIDEAYIEFADDPGCSTLAGKIENLVVLRTLSKAYGLAGARCGAVIAAPSVIDILRRIISPFPLPQPSVEAALLALQANNIGRLLDSIERLKDTRKQLSTTLSGLGFVTRVWPSQANFVLARFNDGPGFYDFARQRRVLLRDFGSQAGLENCVRISCGSAADMNALEQVFSEYSR